MALNIVSNFAANVAQRNLVQTDKATTASLAKLSSGSRVVSARDDAASLAIGSRLRAEVSALGQAQVNAGQASSMLQIADGALSTVSDILVRMKSLAVQAASEQLSSTERTVLDSEFKALSQEITRISDDTEFNGTQLIAGANSTTTTVTEAATSTTSGTLAGEGVSVTFDTSVVTDLDAFRIEYTSTNELLTVTNTTTGAAQTIDVTTALDAAATTNGTGNDLAGSETAEVEFASLGVTVTLNSDFTRGSDLSPTVTNNLSNATVPGSITVAFDSDGGVTSTAVTELATLVDSAGQLTINFASTGASAGNLTVDTTTGLLFSVDGGAFATAPTTNLDDEATHTITVKLETSGVEIATVTIDDVDQGATTAAGTIDIDVGKLLFFQDQTTTTADSSFTFKVGTGADTQDDLSFTIAASSAEALGVEHTDDGGTVDITTAANADLASTAVSSAIDTLNRTRSDIGANQNRLGFATSNLASTIENSEAARSELLDLDIAKEISNFTSKQVLLQAGVSMLAQANQVPQNLLRLLQ